MTRYTVQIEMPCEDPVNNVRIIRKRKVLHFFVPLNHPDVHNMGLCELLEAVERREKLDLFTGLNNRIGYSGKESVVSRSYAQSIEAAARKAVEAESVRASPSEPVRPSSDTATGGPE